MKINTQSKNLLSILTVEQIARRLKVNTWLVESAIRKGELKGSRRFGEFFVKEKDLLSFIESGDPS